MASGWNAGSRRFVWMTLLFGAALAGSGRNAIALGPHGDAFVGFSSFGLADKSGAEAALNIKVFPFVGVEGDFSGYANGGDPAAPRVYLYLAGPRVTVPVPVLRMHLFAHALGGRIEPSGGTGSSGAFLYGLGGGADFPVFLKLNWRVAGDYVNGPSGDNHGTRISTGPVLRF